MSKGRLIVIEGIDGSGKSTQYKMLCDRLASLKIEYRNIVFPRYDRDSSALIRLYLSGAFGTNPTDVNAYTASAFYACDRFASFKDDWGEYYNNGGLIIADRYTTSNAVHQGTKVPESELEAYLTWLSDLEYDKMGLPRPDMVLYMDCDLETSQRRMRHREAETNTSADIHEKNNAYLAGCFKTAKTACEYYGWTKVPYLTGEGDEIGAEEKSEIVFNLIKDIL